MEVSKMPDWLKNAEFADHPTPSKAHLMRQFTSTWYEGKRYVIWYTPRKKCASTKTWFWWHNKACGRHSFRICGWDIYPR